MVYSEFVSADALIRNVNRSLEKIRVDDRERPVAIQIYGRDVPSMVEAAQMVESEAHPDILDINFGCPVKKVAGKGAGAGMLRTPQLMLDITRAVVKAVKIPVTVKTRLGWDVPSLYDLPAEWQSAQTQENKKAFILELAERLQDCGIEALPFMAEHEAKCIKEKQTGHSLVKSKPTHASTFLSSAMATSVQPNKLNKLLSVTV